MIEFHFRASVATCGILNSDQYSRGIGEIFLLNIGLPFNPLKMAQFIKLTGGLLIIIEMCIAKLKHVCLQFYD